MEVVLLGSFLNTYLPKIFSEMPKGNEKKKRLECHLAIEVLEQELPLLVGKIRDQESSGMDSGETAWISESRRLAQEIEDHIEIVLLRHLLGRDSNLKISELTMKTDHLMKRLKSIKVDQPTSGAPATTSTSQVDQRVPYLPDHIQPVEPLKELLELVQEHEEPQKEAGKTKVIAIVGFGGLGKTLRALQVYQSPEVDDPQKFRPRVWVRAGGLSADDILKVIRERLEAQDDGESSSAREQHITDVQRIKRYLQDKRYFIVIDDMREPEQWQEIKDAFPTKLSSRIIVTTTIQSVAKACCCSGGYEYKLLPLSNDHSVDLLVNKLGLRSSEDAAKHAEELLKICEGLPLALISLSRYFQSNSDGLTRKTCEDAYRELGAYLVGDKEGLEKIRQLLVDIYTALDHPQQRKKSNGLDRHILKACLLYFSMFLGNHQTTRNHLIRRWVAEGFGSQDDAIENFKTLMERNVIQSMEVSSDGHAKKCQPPGLMLKYIYYKATSENFVTEPPAEIETNGFTNGSRTSERSNIYVRRLCVNLDSLDVCKWLERITLPLVRTLQVSGERSTEILKFQYSKGNNYYKLLRILELKGCAALTNEEVENICGHLLLLRYLSLQGVGDKMYRIPRKIANLKLLETLHISRTEAVIVPFELILLPSLTHLLGKFQFYGEDEYNNIPSKSQIKLERLSGFVAGQKGFPELMPRMKRLRKVKVWCNRTSDDGTLSEAIKKFIREGSNTSKGDRSLSVDFSGCSNPFKDSDKYPGRLTSLKLKGKMMMERFPQFLELSGIEKLCLSSTDLTWVLIEEGVGQFPSLIYLKLHGNNLHDLAPAGPAPEDDAPPVPEDDAPKDAPSVEKVKPFQKLQRICFSTETRLPPPTILQIGHYLPAIEQVYLYASSVRKHKDIGSNTNLDEEGKILCSWNVAARNHPRRPMVWSDTSPQATP